MPPLLSLFNILEYVSSLLYSDEFLLLLSVGLLPAFMRLNQI